MNFAWAVDALRRGLKVTRKSWAGDPPMYLYVTENKPDGQHIIKMYTGTDPGFDWTPTAEQILTVDDWEEYVEPKKAASDKLPQEDLPVWPEVNADGYARMSKDSDVVVHDLVYRPKKEPAAGYIGLSEKETRLQNNPSYDDTQDSRGGKPAEEPDVEEDTGYIAKLAGMLADSCAEKISQRVVQLLQKTDVPLPKEDTNHVYTDYHRRRS